MTGDHANIVYDARTDELAVDVPGTEFTSINIGLQACIFTGDPAENLGDTFDNETDCNKTKPRHPTFRPTFRGLRIGSRRLG
jgi:hypothetical protein